MVHVGNRTARDRARRAKEAPQRAADAARRAAAARQIAADEGAGRIPTSNVSGRNAIYNAPSVEEGRADPAIERAYQEQQQHLRRQSEIDVRNADQLANQRAAAASGTTPPLAEGQAEEEAPAEGGRLAGIMETITPTVNTMTGQINTQRLRTLLETGNFGDYVQGELTATLAQAGIGTAIAGLIAGGAALFAGAGSVAGYTLGGTTAATGITANGYTIAGTTAMLVKVGLTAGAIKLFMSAVGSYPFSSFIKEEALQTLGFGVHSAMAAGDLEAADIATAQIDEILNSTGSIMNRLPGTNLIQSFIDFTNAARTKNEIDKGIIENRRTQLANGTNEASQRMIEAQQRTDMINASATFRLEQQATFNENERRAREEQRDDDARFWAEQRENERAAEEADRIAIAQFWEDYARRKAELAAQDSTLNLTTLPSPPTTQQPRDSGQSSLNFGLL